MQLSVRGSGLKRRSPGRYGRSRRDQEQNDSIVVALTAQILLCVVVLLAAGIAKRVDPPDYSMLKGQYQAMTGDSSQNWALARWLSEQTSGRDGVGGVVNRAVDGLLERFAGSAAGEAAEEEALAEPDGWTPAEEVDQGRSAFHYQYLNAGDPGGMGGMWPVEPGEIETQLKAPAGASLAPALLAGRMIAPVEGLVTSPYAYRLHPITDRSDFHTGIDIAAEEGRGILAALPGEVVEIVYDDEIYGNYIIMQHATNLKTFYAHCSEILAKEGMALRQGERIAKVGQTGTATGPHLHFSVIIDETFTDPMYVLGDSIRLVEE